MIKKGNYSICLVYMMKLLKHLHMGLPVHGLILIGLVICILSMGGTYRIYKYDKNYKLIKVFGVQGNFRLPKEDIPWILPPHEIVIRLISEGVNFKNVCKECGYYRIRTFRGA